jgi:sugar phosphate isomerase/epimerase
MGVIVHSYGLHTRDDRTLSDPVRFAEFCRARGAAGVQLPIPAADPKAVRDRFAALGLYLEGSVRAPKEADDAARFEADVAAAKAAGATVLRTVMLGGRRYETFRTADEYRAFTKQAARSLESAEPVCSRHKVTLAVENHKDYRAAELADVLRKLNSEYVGACVDTGNNIALLDDPHETVKILAPWAVTCHLKDMAVEEAADGFLLSEVPLGAGFLDLKRIVDTLRHSRPAIRFGLEMITRDPLRIPCLTDGYWATFGGVTGRELAASLALVRKHAKKPLPRVTPLPPAEQRAAEDRNVRESFRYARERLGL